MRYTILKAFHNFCSWSIRKCFAVGFPEQGISLTKGRFLIFTDMSAKTGTWRSTFAFRYGNCMKPRTFSSCGSTKKETVKKSTSSKSTTKKTTTKDSEKKETTKKTTTKKATTKKEEK